MKKALSIILSVCMLLSITAGIDISAYALASSGSCGNNVNYTFNSSNGVLTISGSGDMYNYNIANNFSPFYEQSSIKKVVINDGVTSIGNCMFKDCEYLTDLTIPNSVKRIGFWAFSACSHLTSVELSQYVNSVDEGAFRYCSNLSSIKISSNNPYYDSRNNCNAIINSSTNELLFGCKNTIIPNDVKTIGAQSFCGIIGLTSITIPNSVTEIKEHAFTESSDLQSVTIGNQTQKIGDFAFSSCDNLKSISLPSALKNIGEYAFNGDSNFKDVYYSGTYEQWKAINISEGNDELLKATIHYGAENDPFYFGDVNNDGTVSVADVTTVAAFANNSKTPTDEQFILSDVDNNGIIDNTDIQYIMQFVAELKSTSSTKTQRDIYPIFNSIEKIGYCGAKVKYILFKNGLLKVFGSGAMYNYSSTNSPFYGNQNIKSVIVYKDVTTIGNYAFKNCSSLQNVTLPISVKIIGTGAFSGCTGLKRTNYPGEYSDWKDVAIGSDNEKFISAPRYLDNERDVTQLNISGKCGQNVKYYYNGSTRNLTISGKGKIRDFDEYGDVSEFWIEEIGFNEFNNIVISSGVTYIGRYIFAKTTANKVTIADSVTSIGYDAFSGCTIKRIDLGNGLKKIPNGCFHGGKLETVFIPKTVKTIESYAFECAGSPINVYYNGTKAQWKKVKKQSKNYALSKAKMYYITTPATSLTKLTKYKKAFKATWKKKSGIAGYQIQYALNSKFTKSVKIATVANKNTGSKKISKLKAKKTYYVRVRTYKVVNGKTYYSSWSKAKKVKTK